MPSSISAILSSPYLSYWIATNLTVSNNTATVTSHPFSTGDRIYASISNSDIDGKVGFGWLTLYVIVISSTQFKVATTYSNAMSGISETFFTPNGLSNTPVKHLFNSPTAITFLTQPWLSNSKSAQSFSVTDSVAINFTVPEWGYSDQGAVGHKWAAGLVSDTGNYRIGVTDSNFISVGDSITGMSVLNAYRWDIPSTRFDWTFNLRFLLQDRRISIQVQLTNSTWLTLFTSSIISNVNIQQLRFLSNFALNGMKFTNCTIAYL